jgi:hypothetical protein
MQLILGNAVETPVPIKTISDAYIASICAVLCDDACVDALHVDTSPKLPPADIAGADAKAVGAVEAFVGNPRHHWHATMPAPPELAAASKRTIH